MMIVVKDDAADDIGVGKVKLVAGKGGTQRLKLTDSEAKLSLSTTMMIRVDRVVSREW